MNKYDVMTTQARRALWIRGAATPGGLEIPFSTEREALAFRLSLYRAVRRVKKAPQEDVELAIAVEQSMIQVMKVSDERWIVVIGSGRADPKLLQILADVGITEEELKPPIERQIEASLKALHEKEQRSAGENADPFAGENPYFKR